MKFRTREQARHQPGVRPARCAVAGSVGSAASDSAAARPSAVAGSSASSSSSCSCSPTGSAVAGVARRRAPSTALASSRRTARPAPTPTSAPTAWSTGVVNSVQEYWPSAVQGYTAGADRAVRRPGRRPAAASPTSAVGPFYCPADEQVYIDLGFYDELRTRFGAHGGPFAEAYVHRPRVRAPRAGPARHQRRSVGNDRDGAESGVGRARAASRLLRRGVGRARRRHRLHRASSPRPTSPTASTPRPRSATTASSRRHRDASTASPGRTARRPSASRWFTQGYRHRRSAPL